MTSDVGLRIVSATEGDVPLILEFIRELAAYERHLDRVEATEARVRETLFGPKPAASVIFAFNDDQPVGFAVFYFTYSTFVGLPGLYLEDLFVKPEARGQGIGRQLLSYLARLAKERGCCRIEWAVLHWNEPAIGFYRKLGAIPMEEWHVYRLFGTPLDQLAAEKPAAIPPDSDGQHTRTDNDGNPARNSNPAG
jgi:GNAT superfamily N-acetyltransferase